MTRLLIPNSESLSVQTQFHKMGERYLTDHFFTTRGVRQGYSLSPLVYVLCIEALEASITQYADDSTLVLIDFGFSKEGLHFERTKWNVE